jgi:pyridinium-3,5-biscarboxylic acid mononucleotide sulfurtransferase
MILENGGRDGINPRPMDPKLSRLQGLFREMGSTLVTFSGGVDSSFVLKVAHDVLGDRAIALTAVSPSLPSIERVLAEGLAREMRVEHLLVESDEIHDPRYAANPTNRCYYCKTELYRIAEDVRRTRGLSWIANGTNLDDLGDHRPGLDAAREGGIRSPLVEAEIDKKDVRRIGREIGLANWDKPAAACLSSRLPYGTEVTVERLTKVGRLEESLRALGLRQIRVRYHGEVARIEVDRVEMERAFQIRDAIVAAGKAAGFAYVTLDLEGYRQGSHNEVLKSS